MSECRIAAVLSKTIRHRFSAVLIGIADDSQTKVHCMLQGLIKFSHTMTRGHLLNRCSRYQLLAGFGLSATLQHFIKAPQFPHRTTQAGTWRRSGGPWDVAVIAFHKLPLVAFVNDGKLVGKSDVTASGSRPQVVLCISSGFNSRRCRISENPDAASAEIPGVAGSPQQEPTALRMIRGSANFQLPRSVPNSGNALIPVALMASRFLSAETPTDVSADRRRSHPLCRCP